MSDDLVSSKNPDDASPDAFRDVRCFEDFDSFVVSGESNDWRSENELDGWPESLPTEGSFFISCSPSDPSARINVTYGISSGDFRTALGE